MVTHVCILFLIKLFKKSFLLHGKEKLCSKFGEDQFKNDVTILSTDARWMDGHWTVGSIALY